MNTIISIPGSSSTIVVVPAGPPGPSGGVANVTASAPLAATSGGGAINIALTGTVPIANGGTGQTANGSAGQVLTSTGGAAMAWAAAAAIAITALTGDVTATGPGSVAATVQAIHGATVPVAGALITGQLLQVSGASALSYGALNLGMAASITGSLPLANITHGTAAQLLVTNAGATAPAWVSASQDVSLTAAGAFTVTGLQAKALPALTAGVLQYSGSAWALSTVATTGIAPGTAGQLLLSNATPATTWTTMSGDATIGATGILTVASANGGEYTFTNSGQITIAGTASVAPGILQNATASATPATFTITPQASSAGATANGANMAFALSAPGASGSEGFSYFQRGASNYVAIGALVAGPPSSYAAIYMGPAIAPSSTNAALYSDGTNTRLNGSSTAGVGIGAGNVLTVKGGTTEVTVVAAYNFNVGGPTGSYGGGVGVLGLLNATTQPTSTPSGGIVLASNAGSLALYDGGGATTTIGTGSLTMNSAMTLNPTSTTSTGFALAIKAGIASSNSGTGGAFTAAGGNATGTTSTGGTATLSTGTGTSANGALTVSSGVGTTYGGLGVVSSGNTPGAWNFKGPALTTTQATGGGGKSTLNVATGSFLFAPITWNGVTAWAVLVA